MISRNASQPPMSWEEMCHSVKHGEWDGMARNVIFIILYILHKPAMLSVYEKHIQKIKSEYTSINGIILFITYYSRLYQT